MASGPITSWEIDGETVETASYFIILGSKITADGDCTHEIKRRLLLGRKVVTSLVAQMVKCLPTMLQTQVQSLGWEDPLRKEMATHSGTLAWKTPRTEKCGRLQSMGLQGVGHD